MLDKLAEVIEKAEDQGPDSILPKSFYKRLLDRGDPKDWRKDNFDKLNEVLLTIYNDPELKKVVEKCEEIRFATCYSTRNQRRAECRLVLEYDKYEKEHSMSLQEADKYDRDYISCNDPKFQISNENGVMVYDNKTKTKGKLARYLFRSADEVDHRKIGEHNPLHKAVVDSLKNAIQEEIHETYRGC